MGSEARARLGLAALLSITLVSFSQLFRQGDYPGPILLGMLIAGAIVILMRRLGSGIPSTLLVTTGALYWYLSLVFQAPNTFYGLPTIATGRGLLESMRFAYDKSYIDYAPVPARPGYIIVTIAVMWLAATIGEIATFRLRRPLLASLLPTTLVTFLLVVGTGAGAQFFVVMFIAALLTYWGMESAHRLRSWGRWMSTWSHLKGDAPTTIAGGIARKMGASCVAAAIVAPVFLPYLGTGGIAWRNGTGTGGDGPGGVGTSVDLLASITPKEISQTSATLFTVEAEGVPANAPVYWRLASLSRFDGTTWRSGSLGLEQVIDGEVPTRLGAPPARSSTVVRQSYQIVDLGGEHLPAAVQPLDIAYDRADLLRVDPESGDIQMNPAVQGGATYSVTSRVPTPTYAELQQATTVAPAPAYEVPLPEPLSPEVRELRDSWVADADTAFERLIAIQERLREFTYSLKVEPGTSTDELERFLTETREGYCQQFATAFAVLARSLGYPVRVSIGFLPGVQDPNAPERFRITGGETHAWPEVHFEDYGWIPFEPTPRGIAPAPAYTSDLGSGTIPENGNRNRNRGGQQGPGHRFADGTFADPFQAGDPGEVPGGVPAGDRDTSPAWRPAFTRLLLVIAALVLLWLVGVPMLKTRRVRRRYGAATSPRAIVGAAFAEFQDEATELALRKRPAESAITYAERVASLGVVPRTATRRLARLYETAEYSARDVEARQAEEARRIAAQLRASLWRSASVARKARRLFSAAELIAARPPGRLLRRLRPATAAGLARRL
jgi:TgpA N-terminal domain/Transglutaminase-like superfamily